MSSRPPITVHRGTAIASPRARPRCRPCARCSTPSPPATTSSTALMTFRLDVRWRRLAVRSLDLQPGSLVADLASGTGDLCVELAAPGLRPISIDLSLRDAAGRSQRRAAGPGRHPPAPGARRPRLDGVTCGFALRNLVELGAFFDELGRVVRPGGRIALLDVATPPNAGDPAGATASTSARSCPASAACCPTRRLPVPAEERGVPPEPRPKCSSASARPASPTVQRRLLSGRHHAALTATRE